MTDSSSEDMHMAQELMEAKMALGQARNQMTHMLRMGNFHIEIEEHSIKVSAENGGKRKYNYSRKFKPAVDPESAKATFTNGVLDITVTKVESKPTGRKVAIK